MQEIIFQVEVRKNETGGKGKLSAQRAEHKIPAIIYGGDKPSIPILVGEKDLSKVKGAGKSNAILTLKHDKGTDTVILKEVQRHPVSRAFLHADFLRISLKTEIEVKVPVKTLGEAPGVKLHGGILEYVLRDIEIKCLPTAIPQALTVDISKLDVGHALHVKDILAIPGVTILTNPEQILITVVITKEEAPTAAEAAAAAGAAEPEVIAKGKPKEGEEAAPAAEAGKGAEKGKEKEAPKK
jgi:large subunit ribosomal protein L25